MKKFDKQCLLEVMLYILNATKGADIYHLLKILYFAEQKHLVKWGSRITVDDFRAYEYGPVADQLYHALRNSHRLDPELADMLQQVVMLAGDDAPNVLLPKREANLDFLSQSERECLDESISENAGLTFNQLKEKSHDSAWEKAYHGSSDLMDSLSIARAAGASDAMLEYIEEQTAIDRALA
jgi:uncharacterized phage-associated protein